MSSESHLLSQRNRDHVFHICFQFLKDKYKIELPEKQLHSILSQCMSEMIDYYTNSPPFPSVDEFNKRTIVRAKEKILLLMRDITMPPPPPRPKPRVIEKEAPRANDHMVGAHQTFDTTVDPEPPKNSIDDDDAQQEESFLKKLQNLEMQRNASVVPSTNVESNKAGVGGVASGAGASVLTPKPAAPPPPSGTTVLYLPTSSDPTVRTSKSFVVHSGDRMWSYFHDRSILSWEGPLPVAETYMHCTSLLISPATHIVSPIIRVAIEGPGGHESETICTFMRKGRKWDMWEPASGTLGTMRTVPTPWTIRLFDVTGRLLDLGKDGYTIQEAHALLNKNTKWVFHESIPMLTRGMTLLCRHSDGTVRRHTALHVHESAVEVEGKHTDVVGCVCAIDDLQVTLVFEIIKNESGATTPALAAAHGNTTVPVATLGGGTVRNSIEAPRKGGK